jgi:hypothetical protein
MWAGKPGGNYTVTVNAPHLGGGFGINWIGDAIVNVGDEVMCARIKSEVTARTRTQPRRARRLIRPRRVQR